MATQRLVPYQLTNPLLQSVIPGGRLTLTTGVPVTITDVIGATTIYYTPYLHNVVTLWDGTTWLAVTFAEVSLALGTLTAALPYDVFGFLSSGALATELLAWTNGTTRATTITLQDGRYCKNGDKTRLYVGTFYTTSTTTTEDSAGGTTTQVGGKRFVWNAYNRVLRPMAVKDTTGSWSFASDGYRQANGATGNKVEFVTGADATHVGARCSCPIIVSSDAAGWAGTGVGIDSITQEAGVAGKSASYTVTAANIATPTFGAYSGLVAAGYHYAAWLDFGNSTGSNLIFGGSQGGLTAEVHA